MKEWKLINGKYDCGCRECCGDCSRVDDDCPKCPLDFEGTCENCVFDHGYRKEDKD